MRRDAGFKTEWAVREKRARPTERGFTLIELLAAIAIIVILAALLMSGISTLMETSRRTTCMAHMRQVAGLITQYSTDNSNRLLPAVSGKTDRMDEDAWYELLDTSGVLPGNPDNPNNKGSELWGGKMNSVMACPSRPQPPYPFWVGGRHALHYTVNQNPGFLNRVNTTTGPWPTLAQIKQLRRTFLLAESSFFLGYPDGQNLVYPHPHTGSDVANGQGMNLVFYDGHAEYFKGRLPVLPGGDFTSIRYDQLSPDQSFPWY